MLATLQGSPMAKPESLMDKAGGKCLTCRQAGHWANLVTSLLKWLATNAINWDTGRHSALKCQSSAKPSLTMIQQDWSGPLQQAHLSQITIMGLEPRVQLDVASRSENFLVDTGLPTLSWPPAPEPSPPKPVPFWELQEKQLQKDLPKHFFVAGMDKYFYTRFLWSLSVLLPYWEQISPHLWNLATIGVLIEEALKISLGGKLTIFTSQVKQHLNGRGHL